MTHEHKSEIRGDENALQSVLNELEARQQDLAVAAELGKTLLETNEELRKEHQETLNIFRQQIYELENERRLLQSRLTTVENDYDMQIKELQNNIVSMRIDVQKQKEMWKTMENERLLLIGELTQQNQSMSKRLAATTKNEARLKNELNSLRSQCNHRKASMHDNLHLLESLRQEISQLRAEKSRLELKLNNVTLERDQLLCSLAECRERMNDMELKQEEHLSTIHSQDNEIAHLQERANALHEHLQQLSTQESNSEHSRSSPHRSLLAELAEQRLELLTNSVGFGFPNGQFFNRADGDEEEEVEMDDDALLAYVASLNEESQLQQTCPIEPIPSTSDQPTHIEDGRGDTLLTELRSEVAEIYQQMRQMCVEIQALNEAQSNQRLTSVNGGGTHTPDELAMVEMNFRLNSLRSVLGDLRGLLRELVTDIVPSKSGSLPKQNGTEKEANSGTSVKSSGNSLNSAHKSHEGNHMNFGMNGDQDDATEAMLHERDSLANEVATVQQQLSDLQQQLENGRMHAMGSNKSKFVANWQEFDDEEYEFELPRETNG
ncbi:Bicaudal D protein [Paragonimus skrjabini miyazakii]|uniref:Bicaudal D protein n=1 Tax=Paragonimus skrjabini miyazakii TaxID=59628 RepID=A0A8S9Z6I0_9TREM|nr:Bicaudal D protein [Paragonimus skrjabini miyazakii]